mmetsp:Transcript_10398/g.18083  ORF Transcript_10398/g.18083 Transcript_10398/m.18083 type:complete len:98 (-) Transcript_10398:70-363(-)
MGFRFFVRLSAANRWITSKDPLFFLGARPRKARRALRPFVTTRIHASVVEGMKSVKGRSSSQKANTAIAGQSKKSSTTNAFTTANPKSDSSPNLEKK